MSLRKHSRCPECRETGSHLPGCSFAPSAEDRRAYLEANAVGVVADLEALVRRQRNQLSKNAVTMRLQSRLLDEAFSALEPFAKYAQDIEHFDALNCLAGGEMEIAKPSLENCRRAAEILRKRQPPANLPGPQPA